MAQINLSDVNRPVTHMMGSLVSARHLVHLILGFFMGLYSSSSNTAMRTWILNECNNLPLLPRSISQYTPFLPSASEM